MNICHSEKQNIVYLYGQVSILMMWMKKCTKTYDYITNTRYVSFAVSLPTISTGKALQRNFFGKEKQKKKIKN